MWEDRDGRRDRAGEIAVVREIEVVGEIAMVEKIAIGAYGVVVARCCDQVGNFVSWCLLVSTGGGYTHYMPPFSTVSNSTSTLSSSTPQPLIPFVSIVTPHFSA